MSNEFIELPVNTVLPDLLSGDPFSDELFQIGDLLPIPEHPTSLPLADSLRT